MKRNYFENKTIKSQDSYFIQLEKCYVQVPSQEFFKDSKITFRKLLAGNKGSTVVAVKTLKETATEKEKKDLLQELQVLHFQHNLPQLILNVI